MKTIAFFLLLLCGARAEAQHIQNIYVNLYTDSLKKGTYNYINIDGQLSNGHFIPLDSTQIIFSSPEAKFFGNTIFIPADFVAEKVSIRAVLRADPSLSKAFVVYIKKNEDPPLRSPTEVLNRRNRRN